MRVPCRLPDQDTMHGTKPELRPTEPSIELSEDVKERLRAAGDVEGFGRSQVWETAVCAGRLDGALFKKQPRDTLISLGTSSLQGIVVCAALRVDVGVVFKKQFRDTLISLVTSSLQGIAVFAALRVDVGAVFKKQFHDILISLVTSSLQGIAVFAALRVNVGVVFKKQLRDTFISIVTSSLQGIVVCAALHVNVGAVCKKQFHDTLISLGTSSLQGITVSAALRVNVGAVFKKQFHGTLISLGTSSLQGIAVFAALRVNDYDKLYTTGEDGGETVVDRALRPISQRIRVWYGRIGFGEKLVKDARKRDQLRDEYDFIGFEMEAAGTMNRIPVGVIRGVCDYGDLHKNKRWQPYAAAMAAAYAKAVLAAIPAKASFASIPTAPSPVASPPHSIFYGPIIGQKVIAGTSMQGTNTINFS
ncbi:hypothetical protein MCOR28_009830 [Pyricularia oryzae]|nr:hypothetical protein MCOR26_005554 [Pyricularia oryzae]KAI6335018.1 hypothetical protein MCOR28_009830 [Pyricularia oryzae]